MYVPNVVPTATMSPDPPADSSSAAVLNFRFVEVDKVRFVMTPLGKDRTAALENNMMVKATVMKEGWTMSGSKDLLF